MTTKVFNAWLVHHRDNHDDEYALELAKLKEYASSPKEAWKNFLALTGKTRQHWNKYGYIAQKVQITIRTVK